MKRLIYITALAVVFVFADSFTAFAQRTTSSAMVVTRTRIKKAKEPIDIKWQNKVGVIVSDAPVLTYTGGWRFGNFFYFGFGTGVQVYPNVIPWDESFTITQEEFDAVREEGTYYNPSKIAIPVNLNMKFRFLKTKVSPYLDLSGGLLFHRSVYNEDFGEGTFYGEGVEGFAFADVMVGLDFRLKNGSDISLGLGLIWTTQEENFINDYFGEGRALGGFKLGYSF